jgi:hypothetical protein
MATLYLLETRAAKVYQCVGCGTTIYRGTMHFRHDPHPMARRHRGEKYSHWCRDCILSAAAGPREQVTRRLFVSRNAIRSTGRPDALQLPLFDLVRIECIGIGYSLSQRISEDPTVIHALSPQEFEEFICERLYAMGLEPKRVGGTFQADGGIDVVFWPRDRSSFPFLGAAQVKHHRSPKTKEGPDTVREFVGSISGRPFSAGIIVTNTSFSPDAEWFARQHGGLIRLRGFDDICRWVENNFSAEAEWRELPSSIEVAPDVFVKIR